MTPLPTLLGATYRVRLVTVLRCAATCWMLLAQVWPFSNLSQQHPTCCKRVAKRTQHVAPNNVAIYCVGMLRSFGRGLKLKLYRMQPRSQGTRLHRTMVKSDKVPDWWLIAKRSVLMEVLKNLSAADQAEQRKSIVWTTLEELTKLVSQLLKLVFQHFSFTRRLHLSFHFKFSFPECVRHCIFIAPCHSSKQGCKLFIKRFRASFVSKITITVSTCISFSKKSFMRSEFWQL